MNRFAWILLFIVSPWCLSRATAGEETITYGRIGKAHLYYASQRPSHVAIFLSGDGGWKLGVIDMARELAATQDALIIGVDIVPYLRLLDSTHDECSYAVDDFHGLAETVEKKLGYPSFLAPALVGYSSGATLVYGLLIQAKPDTFAGGVSLGFCPDLWNQKIFCKGQGLESIKNPKAAGYLFQVSTGLRNPWIALQGTIDSVCNPPETLKFVNEVPNGRIVMLPKVGHGFSVPRNWMPQLKEAFRSVYHATPPAHAQESGLPLIDYRRTGGFIGADDHVTITATGSFVFRDRLGATASLQLDKSELAELQKSFAGWSELAKKIHSKGTAPDAYEWTITYGGVSVMAAESDSQIPEQFAAARAAIETLIQRASSK